MLILEDVKSEENVGSEVVSLDVFAIENLPRIETYVVLPFTRVVA